MGSGSLSFSSTANSVEVVRLDAGESSESLARSLGLALVPPELTLCSLPSVKSTVCCASRCGLLRVSLLVLG